MRMASFWRVGACVAGALDAQGKSPRARFRITCFFQFQAAGQPDFSVPRLVQVCHRD